MPARLSIIPGDCRHVTIQTKIYLHEVFVLSLFLFGAECWTLREKDEHGILTAEVGGENCSLSKQKTEEEKCDYDKRSRMKTLVRRIHKCKLRWFAHVKRMDNSILLAKALATLEPGDRNKGQQKKTM